MHTSSPQLLSQPDDGNNLLSYGTHEGSEMAEHLDASMLSPSQSHHNGGSVPQLHPDTRLIINDNSPQIDAPLAPLLLQINNLVSISSGDKSTCELLNFIKMVETSQTTAYSNGQEDMILPDHAPAPVPLYQTAPEYTSPLCSPTSSSASKAIEDTSVAGSSHAPSVTGTHLLLALGPNDDNTELPLELDNYSLRTKQVPDWDDIQAIPALDKEYDSNYGLEMCTLMLNHICTYLNSHCCLLHLLIQSEQVSSMYWEKLMLTLNLLNDGVHHIIADEQMHLTTTLLPIKDMILNAVAIACNLNAQDQLSFKLNLLRFSPGHY